MLSEHERDSSRGSMSTTRTCGSSPSPTSTASLEEWQLDSSAPQSDSRVKILGDELDENSNVVDRWVTNKELSCSTYSLRIMDV